MPAGRSVYDFGKVITGRVRVRFQTAPRLGRICRIRLRHAEVWPPEVQLGGEMGGKARDLDYAQVAEWVAAPETPAREPLEWTPRFHLYCFRYVELEQEALGDPEEPLALQAEFIGNELERAGQFDCSDKLLNQIADTARHTYEALAMHGVSTDCPHREKLGWGAEAEANLEQSLYHFRATPFWRRFLRDWRDAQRESGQLPHHAPDWGTGSQVGGPHYCSSPVHVAWHAYVYSGDDSLLSENYDMTLRWCRLLRSRFREGVIAAHRVGEEPADDVKPIQFLGDWLPPGKVMDRLTTREMNDPENVQGVAELMESNRLYNTLHALLTFANAVKMAKALGREGDAEEMAGWLSDSRDAVVARWIDEETGVIGNGRQAYAALALVSGAFGGALEAKLGEALVRQIVERDDRHFETGVLATTYVLKALLQLGEVDLALDLLQRTDAPSPGAFLESGFTTFPEQWVGGESFCHASFTGLAFWFYQALGGIQPDEERPGFRGFKIAPQFTRRLERAAVRFSSPVGEIRVSWEWTGENALKLTGTVPRGARAQLCLPRGYKGPGVGEVSPGGSFEVAVNGENPNDQ